MKKSILLPIHPITLRFQSKQLEKEYRIFDFNSNLKHIRLCHWISIFYYAVFIFIDLKIFPERSDIFMIIRLGIVCPLFCIGILLTYAKNYQSICHHMLVFYVLLTSGGFLFMGLIVPVEFHFLYFLQLIVCFIFGYTFIKLPYLYASFAGFIAGIAYLFIQFNYILLNENLLLSYTFCLLGIESLLIIISYSLERSGRYSFYLINLLGIEQDQTKLINTELKEIVGKRTVELQQLAESLQKVKKLSGLLPICAKCKKVRDDKGYWNQIESYIRNHSEAEFSHSICPECVKELYPEFNIKG